MHGVSSSYCSFFISLEGLNPELSKYEGNIKALYEREAGPKPEKVCHFVFFEHMLLMELERKHRKVTKEYSHINLCISGALLSMHFGPDVIWSGFLVKILPLKIQKFTLSNRNTSYFSKILKHTHVYHHMVIWDLTISACHLYVKWIMAPSCITDEAFTAFFSIFLYRVPWITAKRAWLDEIVGVMKKEQEEEPEGEALDAKKAQVTSMSSILHKVS